MGILKVLISTTNLSFEGYETSPNYSSILVSI